MKTVARIIVLVVVLSAVTTSYGATWYVRAGSSGDGSAGNPFGRIQLAVTAAAGGDAILVAAGSYAENLIIDSKSIVIQGGWDSTFALRNWKTNVTTINGGLAAPCVSYANCPAGELSGFVLTNGWAAGAWPKVRGGAVACVNSSPTIANNTITGNTATYGAGIACYDHASPVITGNTIRGNTSKFGGGAIDCSSVSSPIIINNTISANTAGYGGGFRCEYTCGPVIINNTIAGNTASFRGGAVYVSYYSAATLTNSILWENAAPTGPEICVWVQSTLTVRYTDVRGSTMSAYADGTSTLIWSVGNMNLDPLFADAANGDFHPRTRHGRWDPSLEAWVYDTATSMTIDSGDPAGPFMNEVPPNGNCINMGAFGNTPEASKGAWYLLGDADLNCTIEVADMVFTRDRLMLDPAVDDNWQADVNRDGRINILDLLYTRNRLGATCAPGTEPAAPPKAVSYATDTTVGGGTLVTAVSGREPGLLILEGPDDRGEPPGQQIVRIDVYGEDLIGFGGVQTSLSFTGLQTGERQFQLQGVTFNSAIHGRFDVVDLPSGTAGFVILSGDVDLPQKTLLYSLTYQLSEPADDYIAETAGDAAAGGSDDEEIPLDTVGGIISSGPADTIPPSIASAWAEPNTLARDNKMHDVAIKAIVNDNADPAPTWRVVSVVSNQRAAAGATECLVTGDHTVRLLGMCASTGIGRTYTITIEAADASGNTSTALVLVLVPRSSSMMRR